MKHFIFPQARKFTPLLLSILFMVNNNFAQNKIAKPSTVTITAATTDSRTWARNSTGEKHSVKSNSWQLYGTCWYWGLKDTLKGVINGYNTAPPNMTCNGLTNLIIDPSQSSKDSGRLVFTGNTTYKYIGSSSGNNYITNSLKVRLTVKISDTLGNFLRFTDIDSAHVTRANKNFNIQLLLETLAPSDALNCAGGYCNKWVPSILLFDILQTDPNSSICTSLNINSFWSVNLSASASNSGPYCEKDTVYLKGSGGNTAKWTSSYSFTSTHYDTLTKLQFGTYPYLLTATAKLGCQDTAETWVTVNASPRAQFSLNQNNQCFNNNAFVVTNTSAIDNGQYSFTWNFGDSTVSAVQNPSPSKSYINSGGYTIVLKLSSDKGCTDSFKTYVNVYPMPIINPFIDSTCAGSTQICKGNNAAFGDTLLNNIWEFSNGSTDTLENSLHIFAKPGIDTVVYRCSSIHQCTSTATLYHPVFSYPKTIMAYSDSSICSGNTIQFSSKSTNTFGNINQILWDFGDNATSNTNPTNKTYWVSKTTSYNVTLYITGDGKCKDSLVKRIDVEEMPKTCNLSAKPDYSTYFWGVKLYPKDSSNIIGGQANVNYTFIVEGIDTVESNGINANALVQLPKDGNYNIKIIARNAFGDSCFCISTATVFTMNRLDIKQLANNHGIQMMPNRIGGTDNIVIEHSGNETLKEVQILSMGGVLIERFAPQGQKDGNKQRYNLEHKPLLEAIYFVRFMFSGDIVTLPLCIE